MDFMRRHWFDLGLALAVAVSISLFFTTLSLISLVLWLSLIALFVHQFEEYRYPGYFPGMMNVVLFASNQPDRYPLNANTALIVNVMIGWLFYALAAVFGEKVIWLGIATILVSVGNFVAHTFLFNFKGKTFYNPGMLTADILFLPISVSFFVLIFQNSSATSLDWILGIGLGIGLNYIGILKLIDWLKDEQTAYIFPKRCLPPAVRKERHPQP
jgi:hypothetical protein